MACLQQAMIPKTYYECPHLFFFLLRVHPFPYPVYTCEQVKIMTVAALRTYDTTYDTEKYIIPS